MVLELLNMVAYKKGLTALARYPQEFLFALFVDGILLEKDQFAMINYEAREPGCVRGAFSALKRAIKDLDKYPIELDDLLEIHKNFTCKVVFENTNVQPGQLRNEEVYFNLFDRNSSREGIRELLKEIKCGYLGKLGAKLTNVSTPSIVYSAETLKNTSINDEVVDKVYQMLYQFEAPLLSKQELEIVIQGLLDKYNDNIKIAFSDDEKLKIIIQLIFDLEHVHPFSDANCRTFVIGLMLRLLLQNGFVPPTFYDPNIFDGYSKSELLYELKKAMKTTRDIINGKTIVFNHEIQDRIHYKDKNLYCSWKAPFLSSLEEILEELNYIKHLQKEKLIQLSGNSSTKIEEKTEDEDVLTPIIEDKEFKINYGLINLDQVNHNEFMRLRELMDKEEDSLFTTRDTEKAKENNKHQFFTYSPVNINNKKSIDENVHVAPLNGKETKIIS